MGNFSIKEDLLKLKGAFITNFKGRTETKRCLVIPVDDSGLYVGGKRRLFEPDSHRNGEPAV